MKSHNIKLANAMRKFERAERKYAKAQMKLKLREIERDKALRFMLSVSSQKIDKP